MKFNNVKPLQSVMSAINLYLDEAGNFDFGPNGTKWLIVVCVNLPWSPERIARLADLRYTLLREGFALEYFHASEDNRHVRRRVFEIIAEVLPRDAITAFVVEKCKLPKGLRDPEKFYPEFMGPLIKNEVNDASAPVFSFSDVLPVVRKRNAIEKSVITELSHRVGGRGSHVFLHHASKSNFDLQIADYCCWAVWRAYARGDNEPVKILRNALKDVQMR